jgi:hypothetical protein
MNLVDLQSTAGAQPTLTQRRSIADLLAPLEQIAANLSHLVANREAQFEAGDEAIGHSSVGFSHVSLGYDKNLEALTITESPLKRLELGYGHFGNVLNDEANGVWGITTKWEF